MRRQQAQLICVIALMGLTIGCGSKPSLEAVSGTVTYAGNPLANVEVIYSPKATGSNGNPGPPSFGVTDEFGRYTLRLENGREGVIAGTHIVRFQYRDSFFDEMERSKGKLDAGDLSESETAQLVSQIKRLQQEMANRPTVLETTEFEFEVANGGTQDADFEITN